MKNNLRFRGQAALESNCGSTARPLKWQVALELNCGSTARPLKGQAALEYLMTYGWALLIIFIVIAALMVIAPVSTPPTCRFDQIGFSCPVPSIDTSGKLFMRIENSNNNDVAISAVACTDDKATTPPAPAQWTAVSLTLPRQGEIDTSAPAAGTVISCKRGGAATTYVQAEDFTGRVWIKYRNLEDPSNYPNRTASAVIATKIA